MSTDNDPDGSKTGSLTNFSRRQMLALTGTSLATGMAGADSTSQSLSGTTPEGVPSTDPPASGPLDTEPDLDHTLEEDPLLFLEGFEGGLSSWSGTTDKWQASSVFSTEGDNSLQSLGPDSSTGPELPATDSLEAYLPMDGDTPVNEVTGNEATVVGEPTTGAEGAVGDAVEFTADGSVDTVADTVITEELPINGEQATVGAWVNRPAIEEDFSRLYHVDQEGNAGAADVGDLAGPTNGWNIEFNGTANEVHHQFWNDGELGAEAQTPAPVPQDEWIFVVTVVDGDEATIYSFDQDGILDGAPTTGGGSRTQSDMAQLMLMTGDARDTPGRMDQVFAYSTALSESEVSQLYTVSQTPSPLGGEEGPGAPENGLEAYYSFDGDTATNDVTGTDAVVTGDPATGVEGFQGSTWEFSLDGSRDTTTDAVTSGEDLPINGAGVTVGGWFRYSDREGYARIWQAGGTTDTPPQNDAGDRIGWELTFLDETDEIRMYHESATGASLTLSADDWYYVVSVVEGDEARLHVFDETGELDASPAVGSAPRDQTDSEPLVMMSGDDSEPAGNIDEVRAYSRALSREEVRSLYVASGGQEIDVTGQKHLYSMPGDGLPGYPRSLDRFGLDVRDEAGEGTFELQFGVQDPMPEMPETGQYYAVQHDADANEVRAVKGHGPDGAYTELASASAQLDTSTWYSYHVWWTSGGNVEVLATDPDGNEVASLSFQDLRYNTGGIGIWTDTGDYYVDKVHIRSSPGRNADGTLKDALRSKVSLPFGLNCGGFTTGGTATVDGLEFVNEPPDAVDVFGNADVSGNDVAVGESSTGDPIDGTENDLIYQSERYGGNLSYDVFVPNGSYDVTLHFAENFFEEDGARVFDVSVQGEQIVDDLDIHAEVGHDTAYTITVPGVEVESGKLEIRSTTETDNTKYSGIEIREAADAGPGVSTPYGLNAGGTGTDGTVEIGGVEFDNAPAEGVTAVADGEVNVATTESDIAETDNDLLYQSENWGADLGYEVELPNGRYNVTLYFAETFWGPDNDAGEGGEGTRVFDLFVQGETIREDFDIYSEVGANTALTITVEDVAVTDNTLTISSSTQADNTKYSGFLIEEVPEVDVPYGLDAGGTTTDGTFELGGVEFDDEPGDAVTVTSTEPEDGWPDFIDADLGYGTASTEEDISGTDADLVYQSEIFSNDLGFDVAIPNGVYDVRLHFSEITFGEEGARVFDVSVQDRSVLEDYDIVAAVGQFAADVVTVNAVEVTDNTLSISTTTDTNFSKFAGIEIRESNPVETPFGLDVGGSQGDRKAWLRRPTPEGEELVVFRKNVPEGVEITSEEPDDGWPDFIPADPGYGTSGTGDPIDGTVNDVLYQSEIFSNDLGFQMTIPNGNYDVYLHNAEVFHTDDGNRVFDVLVQGETIVEDYDIHAAVGHDTADVLEVNNVEVTDGTLTIGTNTEVDYSKFAGIEVRDHVPEVLEAPYGFNAGGTETDGTVEIDGLAFDDELDEAVTPIGDPTPSSTGDDIAGTDDDLLYRSQWTGEDIGFEVTVPDGVYEVTLHFAEIENESNGARVFDLMVQGETIAEGYDIHASVGADAADVVTVKNVQVTDGTLTIETASQTGASAFSGFAIRTPRIDVPYGLNAGGSGTGGTVEIDGLTFDNEPGPGARAFTADGDPNVATTGAQIANTTDDLLYQSENWGPNLSYDFALANGTYDVTLHFAEFAQGSEGARVFDVIVQDETIVEGYDIYAAVGANTADVVTIRDVQVTDGLLSIETATQVDNTKFSGIEIRESTTPPVETPYGFNAGGTQTDGTVEIDGLVYDDTPAEGVSLIGSPTPTATDADIAGTDTDLLYQSEWFGTDIGFDVTLENGIYDVTLHFAETFFEEDGARVFDVIVQGETIADDYDIHAAVGANAADVVTIEGVEVTDGSLTIETNTEVDNSKFSGFEIRERPTTSVPYGLNAGGDALEGTPADALGDSSLADGLEAYLSLDGERATNLVTGTDATLYGSPTPGAPGAVGNAFRLDASGSGNFAEDALITEPLPLNGDAATISLWVNYTSHQGAARIFQTSGTPNSVPSTGFNVEMGNDDAKIVTWDNGLAGIGGAIDLSPNTWYNMTAVMDGEEFRLHVFDLEGELDASPITNTLERSNTGMEQLIVGAGDGGDVAGRFDEIHAYSRALSETEVSALYSESASGALNGLVVQTDDGLTFDNEPNAATNVTGTGTPNVATTDAAIDGTDADPIYQSEHWGNNLSYEFYIENGSYDVTLHFAETFQNDSGIRVFDLLVQGELIVEDLDIYDEVGMNTAYTVTAENVEVTNNTLTIETNTSADNTKFSGIEIRGDPEEVSEDAITPPYGLNTGGADSEVTIDGLTFANEPDDRVQVWQDVGTPNTSYSGTPVTAGSPAAFQTILDAREDPDGPKEVDLSELLGTGAVQLRFSDHDTSDGLGAQLVNLEVRADGTPIASLGPGVGVDEAYLAEESGSNPSQDSNIRFADAEAFFTYEFPVPEGTDSLTATIDVNNEFLVDARGAPDPVDGQYIYQTENWFEGLEYEIAMPNGSYDVTLHFAETAFSSEGARVFDVWVQGQPVATDLDIYAEVGANTPMTMDVEEVQVDDGTMRIAAMASVNNAKFSGIEIRGPGVVPPYGFDAGGTAIEGSTELEGLVLDQDPVGNDDVEVLSAGGINTATTGDAILGTDSDAVYQSELWGPDLGFEIRAPNDDYEVRLHFAETFQTEADVRVFDLLVQGNTIISGLDLYDRVGHDVAYPITLRDVAVEDNSLAIETATQVDNTKISAVEMRRTTEPDPPRSPFGADPPQLVFLDELPEVEPDSTATVSARLTNPYLFTLQDGEVTMEAPSDDWEITPTSGTTFDTLGSRASQSASWEVTVPPVSAGEYTITANVKYESASATAQTTAEVPLTVVDTGPVELPAPDALEAYLSLDDDTVVNEVTGNEAAIQSASPGAEGAVGGAWEFATNGSADGVADAVVTEPLPLNGEQVTVGGWVNYTEAEQSGRIYHVDSGGDPAAVPANGWNIEFNGDSPELIPQYWDTGDFTRDTNNSLPVEPETWFYVVTVFNGNDSRLHVFDQDGEIDGSPVTNSGTRTQSDAASLMLMAGDGRETAGRMDQVHAFSAGLSESEVSQLYEASKAGIGTGGDEEAGLPTEGLVAQYDATDADLSDGDAVPTWPASTGDIALTQDSSDAQPTYVTGATSNGDAAVRFEGDGDFLDSDSPLPTGLGATLSARFRVDDHTVPRQAIAFNGSDQNGNGFGIFLNQEGRDSFEGTIEVLYGGVSWYLSETTIQDDQFHTATALIPEDGSAPSLYLDGEELSLTPEPGGTAVEPTDQFGIGEDEVIDDVEVDPHFDGDVAELVAYERVLPDSDREALEAYLESGPGDGDDLPAAQAHYPLDSDTPTDAVGDNDATINGDPDTGATGQVGGAYDFDGDDDFLTYPDLGVTYDGSADWATSLWINPDTLPSEDHYFLWHPRAKSDVFLYLDGDTSEVTFATYDGSTTSFSSGVTPATGEWTHVCVVSDTSADEQYHVFVDGSLEATGNLPTPDDVTDSNLVGGQNAPGLDTRYFDGRIDETRLYDRALSAEEVSQLASAGSDGGGGEPPMEYQVEAIAPEYYDSLDEGQDAPGSLPAEEVVVELDLTPYIGTGGVQLRFEDYWPSDGWGALLYDATVSVDGESVQTIEPGTGGDSSLIVDDNGSDPSQDWNVRFADGNSYWVYEFDIPADADSATATLGAANGFRILARAVESSGGDDGPALDQGLSAHWNFESDTVSDGGVSDQSGNDNDGSFVGDPEVDSGAVGDGMSLHSDGDWVQVDHSDSLQVQTGDFTLAAWVNTEVETNQQTVISKKTDDGVGDDELGYQMTLGGYGVSTTRAPAFQYADGSGVNVSSADQELSTDTWYHLAVSYDHENTTVEWFIDGSSVKTEELSGTPITNEQELFLGAHFDSSGNADQPLDGMLDDVRIYDEAKDESFIGDLHGLDGSSGDSTLDQGLVAHWTFESDTVSDGAVTDQSGNGNDGSIIGDPSVEAGTVGDGLALSSSADWVQVDHSDSLQVQTGDFTLAGWVNVRESRAISQTRPLVSKKTDDGVGDNELAYQLSVGGYPSNAVEGGPTVADAPTFVYADGDGNLQVSTTDESLSTDTWHHLAVSYDHENSTVEWFANGSSVKTEEMSGTPITNEQELFLGVHFDSGGAPSYALNGLLDDVRIYGDAKDATFIQSLYELGN